MDNEWRIVPMVQEHLDELARLEALCFSSPWSRKGLEEELGNPSARFFTALRGEKVAGYGGMQCAAGEYYIDNIAVFPEYRRRGAGDALVRELILCARREKGEFLSLEVRESNREAIRLYERNGFLSQGKRPGFYTAPKEDAVIMTLFFRTGPEKEKI